MGRRVISFEGRRAVSTNLYTLEGVHGDASVGPVIASSPRHRTVNGFLRSDPKLRRKALRMGFVFLFVRQYRAYHGRYLEFDETVDQLELDREVERGGGE